METKIQTEESFDLNQDELIDLITDNAQPPVPERRSVRKRISPDQSEDLKEKEVSGKVKKTTAKSDIKEEAIKQEKNKKRKKDDNKSILDEEPKQNKKDEDKKKKKGKVEEKHQKEEEEEEDKGSKPKEDARGKKGKGRQAAEVKEEPENLKKDKKKGNNKEKDKTQSPEKISKPKKEKDKEKNEVEKECIDKKEPSVKRLVDEEGDRKIILEYMIQQNRPYSAINIYDNLHGKIKKAQVIRILDDLADNNKLIRKDYNQKIYLAHQSFYPAVDEEENKKIDLEMDNRKKLLDSKQQQLKKLQNEYKTITAKMTDEEIRKQILEKQAKLKDLQARLERYNRGDYQKVPEEEVKIKEKNFEIVKNNYKKARKVCINIVDGFCEAMEQKRGEVMKTMNLQEEEESDLQYSKL